MEENYFYSVIIPIYNTDNEKIDEAVKSCINDKTEVLLIDDGSKKKTADFIDSFVTKYKNVKVFHNENQGVASSRNFGIYKASGQFIMFLDSDDKYSENAFQELDKVIENDFDVICFGLKKVTQRRTFDILYGKPGKVEDINSFKANVCNVDTCLSLCWNKVYRKDFLIKNNFKYKTDLKLAEDAEFSLKVFDKANNIYNLPYPLYVYKVDSMSSSHKVNPDIAKNYVKSMDEIWKLSGYSNENLSHLVIDHLLFTVVKYSFKTNKPYKSQRLELKELMNTNCYAKAFKYFDIKQFSKTKRIMLFLLKMKMFYILKLCIKAKERK